MNIRFLTLAQQEVDDAVFWYNNQTENAGLEFLDELDRAVRLVRSYPHALTEIEPEIRRSVDPLTWRYIIQPSPTQSNNATRGAA
jgi:plasmid stabilization system protein ParE